MSAIRSTANVFELNYYGISQGWSSSSIDGLYKLQRMQHGVSAYGEGEHSWQGRDYTGSLAMGDAVRHLVSGGICEVRRRLRCEKEE